MSWFPQALDLLSRGEHCVLVTVCQVKGSAPREPGAKMLVWECGTAGSVGGGHLEFRAIALARRMLATSGGLAALEPFSLGPDLDQCCGGQVRMLFEALDESARPWLMQWMTESHGPCAAVTHFRHDATTRTLVRLEDLDNVRPEFLRQPIRALLSDPGNVRIINTGDGTYVIEAVGERRDRVFLFGAGHVGKAVVRALAPLPFHVTWIDGREDAFPPDPPPQIRKIVSALPPQEVAGAPDGAVYLVMTHSHPLDLEICAQVLRRDDFGFLGLIGS